MDLLKGMGCAVSIVSGSMLAFAVECSQTGCDNKAPSASVGSCLGEYVDCASFQNENDCNYNYQQYVKGYYDNITDVREVKQDFPTSCVDSAGKNCNEPLSNCWRRVICIWENGKCNFYHEWNGWVAEKKRTECTCKTGG